MCGSGSRATCQLPIPKLQSQPLPTPNSQGCLNVRVPEVGLLQVSCARLGFGTRFLGSGSWEWVGVGTWSLGVVARARHPGAAPQPQQRPVFRSTSELISIDVVVRDKNGNVVRGLTAADFELKEDGQAQQVENFTFQEISDRARGGRRGDRAAGRRRSEDERAGADPDAGQRRGAGADDVRGARRAPADGPALRRQLDAARGRAARRRLGAQVREGADGRRRPRRGRDRRARR